MLPERKLFSQHSSSPAFLPAAAAQIPNPGPSQCANYPSFRSSLSSVLPRYRRSAHTPARTRRHLALFLPAQKPTSRRSKSSRFRAVASRNAIMPRQRFRQAGFPPAKLLATRPTLFAWANLPSGKRKGTNVSSPRKLASTHVPMGAETISISVLTPVRIKMRIPCRIASSAQWIGQRCEGSRTAR
jgi:hypothetical protein